MNWLPSGLFDLLLAAFATYRLGRMLSQEDGPFELFAWFRGRFTGNNWVATGVRCFYCVSFWVALLLSVGLFLLNDIDVPHILLVWPGIAGAAIVIEKYWLR